MSKSNDTPIEPVLGRNIYSRGNLNEDLVRGSSHYEKESALMGSVEPDYKRPSLNELATREFYQQDGWFEDMCEALFKIKARGTTIKKEVYHGIIHFISCLYCLAVVPQQLGSAGYDSKNTVVAVALCSGIGSIFCGLFANLPFVLAPPTVVTIFQSVFLQQNGMGPLEGNYGVMISGAFLMLFGWRPLGEFIRHLIPLPIQVGTAVGIGLLTTLAGSTEMDFVISGEYKILRMGPITPEIAIAFFGVFMICVSMRFHIKGSFCIAVVICSIVWWIYDKSFPNEVFAVPAVSTVNFNRFVDREHVPLLTADLLFLYVLYLNGLVTSLSNLAVLTREDGATPRGRWVFIMSGFFTICGGLLTSAPILVSPESSAAIKEGAKTGLSTLVAGVLFIFAALFSPVFERVPAAGTSPVLVMIGLILFQNANRIDWRNVADAAPAFMVLFYIPFTYSIIQGVILGYIMYIAITLCTGEFLENLLHLYLVYFPGMEATLSRFKILEPYLMKKHSQYRSAPPSVRSGMGGGGGLHAAAASDSGSEDGTESFYRPPGMGVAGAGAGGNLRQNSADSSTGNSSNNNNNDMTYMLSSGVDMDTTGFNADASQDASYIVRTASTAAGDHPDAGPDFGTTFGFHHGASDPGMMDDVGGIRNYNAEEDGLRFVGGGGGGAAGAGSSGYSNVPTTTGGGRGRGVTFGDHLTGVSSHGNPLNNPTRGTADHDNSDGGDIR